MTQIKAQEAKSVWQCDPIIGCPFDDSEIKNVAKFKQYYVGNSLTLNTGRNIITVEIFAIGVDAKMGNGDKFTAIALKYENRVMVKNLSDIEPMIIDPSEQ